MPLRAAGELAPTVRYNRDVRPILAENCFVCHGPDLRGRQAELRLDLRQAALADRDGQAAIVPGNPDAGLLLARITHDDRDMAMQPPDSRRGRLTPAEIEMLRRWIEQGAQYEGHWAFEPLSDDAPSETLAGNPIDAVVDAKLVELGIQASGRAPRAVQIRRVYLDLIGLLPSPEETMQFVRDDRPDAWERVVDHLLASEHYGERWGRHWLDQARYADSHGYSIDGEREMWPFRDWVIDAHNRDKPFDQLRNNLPAMCFPRRPGENRLRRRFIATRSSIKKEGPTTSSFASSRSSTGSIQLARYGSA